MYPNKSRSDDGEPTPLDAPTKGSSMLSRLEHPLNGHAFIRTRFSENLAD